MKTRRSSLFTQSVRGCKCYIPQYRFLGHVQSGQSVLGSRKKSVEPPTQVAFEYETTSGKMPSLLQQLCQPWSASSTPRSARSKKASGGRYPHASHSEAKSFIVEHIESEQLQLAKMTSIMYPGIYNVNQILTPRLERVRRKHSFVLPVEKDIMPPIIDAKESMGLFV